MQISKLEAQQEYIESLPITQQLKANDTNYEIHDDGIYLADHDLLIDNETGEVIYEY